MKYLKSFFILFFAIQLNSQPINTGHAEVSLIKGTYANNTLSIGIKMDMQEGWHTYWKNPGDSGGPIKVNWNYKNDSIQISDVLWPAPELIPYEPLMTYGYKNFVVFPFEITSSEVSIDEIDIEANIDFLICADVCVPEKAYINTTIGDMNKDNSLDYWLNRVPEQTLPTIIEDDGNFLDIRFSYNQPIEEIYFYIDQQGVVLHSGEQILVEEENNWLLKVPLENKISSDDQVNGVILINKSIFLVSNEQELILDETKAYSSAPQISFMQALIFAFIGGLILNLMPCVFPIISLKILSFVSLGKESKTKIRHHALSFCSGVLISFLLIGLTIVLLKEAGSFIGWGFQLQSPLIVAVLSMIMFAIGIILLTDIDIGSSFTRLGGIGSNSISGSFLTGVLAVIVASPCTAPFMGAALGYALIQPSGTTLPVFASLGFGFAFPYLILSIYPNLISSLPKPGNWMITLKQFFAFPMFATSLWLIWIFGLQTDTNLLINLLIGLLIMSLLFWMITIFKSKALKLLAWLMIILVVFNQGLKLSEDSYYENGNNSGSNTSNIAQNNNKYMAWESGIEEMLQSDSQAYLINFTAAWCITCQANDKIALSRPKIKEYMKKNDIKYIVADWTNKNNEILKALENYNRNGVPLYVFWKPGFQTAEVLPAILTEQILLDTFEDDIIDN